MTTPKIIAYYLPIVASHPTCIDDDPVSALVHRRRDASAEAMSAFSQARPQPL